ncbi:zinc-dependent peptidase [Cytophagaceae bacterium YF14B1]|uniref:Zinc-dependent peptidase n=1 Tax=Xanthocytophaga flava TaxID=3048013 RepID=A0AAE3QUA8_9BACT|nr:zinc-dependent peptidase [Xanthocytophaga flavus]MDJ1483508.1 zinc-dependent peptidase [Xanthocytophaga flavus]
MIIPSDHTITYQSTYRKKLLSSQLWTGLFAFITAGLLYIITPTGKLEIATIICLLLWLCIGIVHWQYNKKYYRRLKLINSPFPEAWKRYLEEHSTYYQNLTEPEKEIFNTRVQFFLAEKKIEGIDTEIDDTIKLLVAASAIIPTFAFPFYDYRSIHEILIYPNSFDESFQTTRYEGHEQRITGMVGNRFMEHSMILSKPDLIAGFDGTVNKNNVGIHEFVHLLDKEDGAVDGLPEIFLNHSYTSGWLQAVKQEIDSIQKGHSDINPYGLTNNAEFLAVVSEYFFDNPEKFHKKHPELYAFLSSIFHQQPD